MFQNENQTKKLPIVLDERGKLILECLKIIEEYKIFFITDLVGFLPISRATFYNYGLDKLDIIKDAIATQRIKAKQLLKARWLQANAPATCQIALYKLLGTQEERAILSNNFIITNDDRNIDLKNAYLETLKNMNNAD